MAGKRGGVRVVGRLAKTAEAMEAALAILKDWPTDPAGRPVPASEIGDPEAARTLAEAVEAMRGFADQIGEAVARPEEHDEPLPSGQPADDPVLARWLAQMEELQGQILERLRQPDADAPSGATPAPFTPDAITFLNAKHTLAALRSMWAVANGQHDAWRRTDYAPP